MSNDPPDGCAWMGLIMTMSPVLVLLSLSLDLFSLIDGDRGEPDEDDADVVVG